MRNTNCQPGSETRALSCEQMLLAVGDSLYAIGGKWKLRIVIALSQGHSRFNDLVRTIPGISGKALSAELKELETNGFVTRAVIAESTPVIVEYKLTAYAHSLESVVYALIDWGVQHRQKLKDESGAFLAK
jgi:DNA-binding HxlR family transcriptional regulator